MELKRKAEATRNMFSVLNGQGYGIEPTYTVFMLAQHKRRLKSIDISTSKSITYVKQLLISGLDNFKTYFRILKWALPQLCMISRTKSVQNLLSSMSQILHLF